MTRTKIALRILALSAIVSTAACPAQTPVGTVSVHLDPARTRIEWTLGDVLHTVHGTFQIKGGLVTFDPSTGVAQGEVLVDASSGESGNKTRDARMQREVLESSQYPQIIFHPARIAGAFQPDQPGNLDVAGTFTIHGKDHPLTLHVHVQPESGELTMTTSFDVPYVAWGMKDPSTLMLRVSKDVKVEVTAHGSVERGR